jgi:hypothetical protein
MLIRCQSITDSAEAMEIELSAHSQEDRQFVTDRYTQWGYRVVAVRDTPLGMPAGILVLVNGDDRDGIIDKMCEDPQFDVKC